MPKNKIEKKDELDRFYTKNDVAKSCLDVLGDISEYALVIEPSAGDGSFSSQISHANLISIDIAPGAAGIKQGDWFEYRAPSGIGNILVVGNPPFGSRNKLSREFIKHAIAIGAKTIAFVLPDVFHKHTNQKIFPSGWRLKAVVELPPDSFLLEGESYHVPCSFFIFEKSKGKNLMFDVEKYSRCDDFEFSTTDEADFFVLGAAPATIKEVDKVGEKNRGYYIKATGLDIEELKRRFRTIPWSGFSSINGGAFWLTKPELIKCYEDKKDE